MIPLLAGLQDLGVIAFVLLLLVVQFPELDRLEQMKADARRTLLPPLP